MNPNEPNPGKVESESAITVTGERETTFKEPWQAQIFALVVQMHKGGAFSWTEWSEALGAEKKAAAETGTGGSGSDDYRFWLTTLEKLLDRKGITHTLERVEREEAWRRAALATSHGEPIELKTQSGK